MKTMLSHVRVRAFMRQAFAWLLSVIVVQAQDSATGSITGRVLNPATGEYVRNAEVRIEGTSLAATTEPGGFYRLLNVPAGPATISVSYAGYATSTATVQVGAGQMATQDFEIRVASTTPGGADAIELTAFVVASEREGNAKALMAQRNSMNVGRAIASDVFGDVTEGNVGEFLKYLPGIELEYVEADTRGPRLGGMDPEYAGVSIDGMKLASADAFVQYGSTENGSTGSGSRSFGFEQVSINSIESIEINRVVSADMDADAPAGNINLKTKRAFDSKGRRINWSVATVLNSEEFHLKKSVGPNDGSDYKIKPTYSLNYSDTFFNNRLGILVGISESNLYNEQYRIDHTYNRNPTANDPRPQVLTALNFKDGPKWTERFTATFTSDFRATSNLVLSLSSTFNAYDARFYNRTVGFQAAANNAAGRVLVGGDGVNSFTTAGAPANARTVSLGGGNGVKLTNSFTIIPKFEYTLGSLTVDGAMAYSRSKNDYDNLVRGTAANAAVNGLQDVGFTATRSDSQNAEWQIRQTSGPDWANAANYTNTRLSDDGRFAMNEVYNGEFNARYVTPFRLPTFIKIGGKVQERLYDFDQLSPLFSWSYIGPGGNTRNPTTGVITGNGTYAGFVSPFVFDMGQTGGKFTSLSGGGSPPFASRDALARLYFSNPEYFVNVATADNYATARFLNHRDYTETVSAGYVMANTRLDRWTFQAGVRYELTEKESKEFDPLTNAQVRDAGFPVANVNVTDPVTGVVTSQPLGNPTTIPGVVYKYTSRPQTTRTGDYDNFFPSVTAKFRMSENLIADFGYGKAIKRPDINRVNGVWQIDEVAETIRAPNPNLLPELSEKLVAAVAYYFGSSGNNSLQLVASHTEIKNLLREQDLTAEEFGVTHPDLQNYTFITGTSEGPPVTFRSLELSYSQQLTFLPDLFRGTSVFGGYTRTYADERRPGLTPHTIKGGFNYRYKRVSFALSGVWLDEAPWTNTVGRFRRQNIKLDLSGGYRINSKLSLFFQGRNILETPHRIFETINGNPKVLWRLENYGTNWTFGVKGNF